MRRTQTAVASKPKKGKGRFIRFTIILLLVALMAILFAGLTFIQGNKLMRDEKVSLDTYAANNMHSFIPVTFLSLDDHTNLNGWFFPAKNSNGISLIIIHPHASHRLPFGNETRELIQIANKVGYNVLTFDQRHAGSSDGELSTFGYTEWEDVVAAMRYLYNATGSPDVVLYGIGCGVTSAIAAWNHLPEGYLPNSKGEVSDGQATEVIEEVANEALHNLTFRRNAIKGMILDSPLPFSDDYIKYAVQEGDFFLHSITKHTVPYAVRLTAGLAKNIDITKSVRDLPIPVLIIQQTSYGEIDSQNTNAVSTARLTQHHGLTDVYTSKSTGLYESFFDDQERYIEIVLNYLKKLDNSKQ
ncbi:MAG: hypothetical protein ACOYCB_07245 [Fastidiosipilaceae bacterium]|jgi:hypothetical protein|nr:hypothetical protein [Clostridiaceae bacterium]